MSELETDSEGPESIGILGGTFDPVHLGHLILAQDAMEWVGMDRVLFMPTARSPLKRGRAIASDEQRLELLRGALEGHEKFEIDDTELRRSGVSYTLDTVLALKDRYVGARLYWIIGADQLELLPQWYRIDELARWVSFIVATRPSYSVDRAPLPDDVDLIFLPPRPMAFSSTEIRRRIKAGLAVDLFLPSQVHQSIEKHKLYR